MKRLISIFLAVVMVALMVIPYLPTQAYAAGESRYTVLVLDISGAVTFTSGGVQIYEADTAVEYVKTAAVTFLEALINAPGENYAALVVYAEEADVVVDFTDDIDELTDRVEDLSEQSKSGRSIAEGLNAANDLIEGIGDEDAIKNVLLFTTGMTSSGVYDYDGHYNEDTVGSNWVNTGTQIHLYAYANEAYAAAEEVKEHATLYTMGLFKTMDDMPEAGMDVVEFFKMTARDLASSEDEFYDVEDPEELEFAFGEIAKEILQTTGTFRYAGQIITDYDSEATYYYTDAYFMDPASDYDPSLATMSLCLELSSWSSYDYESWYNDKYTPEDDEFWQDKLVNAKTLLLGNPEAGLGYEGIGFKDFSANDDWKKVPDYDSIGVCAARKEIVDNNKKYTLIAVAVRGGGYGSEWASNFTIGDSNEHQGFAKARDKVLAFLKEYIGSIPEQERQYIKLWIVGYSRAGATANMVAGKLVDEPMYLGTEIKKEDIYCYTFEAPQGVLDEQVRGEYSNIHNIINVNDLVPMVAPSAWKFTRYKGVEEHYLPSIATEGDDFDDLLADMKVELDEMGYGRLDMLLSLNEFQYAIDEQWVVYTLKVNKENWLPFGEPFIEKIAHTVDTQDILISAVDYLANDLIGSRDRYVLELQDGVREMAGIFLHYDGAVAGMGTTARNQLRDFFALDNMIYILSPMLSVAPTHIYGYEERMEDVRLRVEEKAWEMIEPLSDMGSAAVAVVDILWDLVSQVADDISNNNLESLTLLCQLFDVISFQPHYPEITLAWLRSEDSNYNSDIAPSSNSAMTRIVRINCPVNVYVYNPDGELVASIVDGEADGDSRLVCYVNAEGEMAVYLPGDKEYSVQMEATADGEVNYSIGEYSFTYAQTVRLQNYYAMEVSEGDSLEAWVGAASDDSLKDNSAYGSDAEYAVYVNGDRVWADEEYLGSDAATRKHSLTVSVEGNGGYAYGTGTFQQGSFAQVEAYTLPNAEFYGWYDRNGNLVSTESVYRFAVLEETQLIAKFTDLEYNALTLEATEGGSVQGASGYFPEDIQISLIATPMEGYEFVGWQITGGTIDDPELLETTFVMPDDAVTVTALFRPEQNNSNRNAFMLALGIALSLLGIFLLVQSIRVACRPGRKRGE